MGTGRVRSRIAAFGACALAAGVGFPLLAPAAFAAEPPPPGGSHNSVEGGFSDSSCVFSLEAHSNADGYGATGFLAQRCYGGAYTASGPVFCLHVSGPDAQLYWALQTVDGQAQGSQYQYIQVHDGGPAADRADLVGSAGNPDLPASSATCSQPAGTTLYVQPVTRGNLVVRQAG